MNNELVKLYKELNSMPQSTDIKNIKEKIEETLQQKLKINLLELLEIGGVLGYDKLQLEMERATQFVQQLKNQS